MMLNRVSSQSWRSRQLFLWRPTWWHHPHGDWRAIWQYAWLHDPPRAEETQGVWRCVSVSLPLNVRTKLICSSCCYCRFEEHKLWEHPADCPEHRRAGPRPGLWPQLHVSFCTVCMRQWAECKRWASMFNWNPKTNEPHTELQIMLNFCLQCQIFLQDTTQQDIAASLCRRKARRHHGVAVHSGWIYRLESVCHRRASLQMMDYFDSCWTGNELMSDSSCLSTGSTLNCVQQRHRRAVCSLLLTVCFFCFFKFCVTVVLVFSIVLIK